MAQARELHQGECEKKDTCKEHMLWEEKVERIPSLLSWMNITKGVMLVVVVLITILFNTASANKSELIGREKEFESEMNRRQEKMDRQVEELSKQVRSINDSVNNINTNVQVMTKTYEMSFKQVDNDLRNRLGSPPGKR